MGLFRKLRRIRRSFTNELVPNIVPNKSQWRRTRFWRAGAKAPLDTQYEGKRTDYWYCRVATGNRKYAHRSLKTTDKATASERAYAAFAGDTFASQSDRFCSPRTIVNLCERWIKRQQDRNDGGTLSTTLTKSPAFVLGLCTFLC